jgi:hypothetical protein
MENSPAPPKTENQAPGRSLPAPLSGNWRRYGELRPIYGEFPGAAENRKPGARPESAGAIIRELTPIRRIEADLWRIRQLVGTSAPRGAEGPAINRRAGSSTQ